MSTSVSQPEQAPSLGQLLAGVRAMVRRYVWIEGIALAVAWIGLSFWITLALDWCFEPPPAARRVMFWTVLAILGWILYRYLLRRIFVRIGDTTAAVVLERRFPDFRDSLVTSVELAGQQRATEFNREMFEHTQHEAQSAATHVDVRQLFRWPPLVGKVVAAGVLLVSIAAFGIMATEAFGIWFSRNLRFSDQLWPRQTRLVIDDFDRGVVKVGKGADRVVLVHAETKFHDPKRVVPEKVQIRYQSADGARGREYMSQEGEASAEHQFADFKFVFKGILVPLTFDVIGGDDRIRNLQIEVVDNPIVEQFLLSCQYPEYMNRTPREIPVTGTTSVPQGTRVTILARSNKPLAEVTLQRLQGQVLTPQPSPVITGDGHEFAVAIDPLMEDYTLLFSLLDTDGIRTREPVRLTLTSVPDEPPLVAVRLRGIGAAITPIARLPIEGEITDAYGIAKVWFEFGRLDQEAVHDQPFTQSPQLAQSLKFNRDAEEGLDLQEMGLGVGKKLKLSVKASDACTLNAEPNVGSSEPYTLSVVTPEELRAILEARELTLRRQFETIIEEMTETRDSLARIDFSGSTSAPKQPAEPVVDKVAKLGAEPEDTIKPRAPADPDNLAAASDTAEAGTDDKPLSPIALRRLRMQRAQQNSQKSGLETLGVANAFDDIREELVNNRIDTEELRLRLSEGIVAPLRRVCQVRFPKLDQRLEDLKATVGDADKGPAAAAAARQEADAILVEMDQVLHKMLELEQFNELVEQLRQIIDLQSKVNDDTQKRRKEKAKSLLQDE